MRTCSHGTPEPSVLSHVRLTLQQTLERRGASLTWLSTEGSGVPWLHVRMDSSPKYYHYDAYRRG